MEDKIYNILRNHRLPLKKREELIVDLLTLFSSSLPSFDDIDETAKEKCGIEKIHERRAFCDGAEWMKSRYSRMLN